MGCLAFLGFETTFQSMFLRHFQSPECEPGFPAPRLTQGLGLAAPSSARTKVQPVVRRACHAAAQLCFCGNYLASGECWLDGTLHIFHLLGGSSSQQLLPTQQEEGQCRWICWRRIDVTRSLSHLTHPRGPAERGLCPRFAQS